MARIRSIKPELASDLTLAGCAFEARYTFVLIISQADDYGLLLAAPRQLLGLLYPHDHDVTESRLLGWIEELVLRGRLRWRETTDGAQVLEVVHWTKHQRVKNPGKPLLQERLKPVESVNAGTLPTSSGKSTPTLPRSSVDPGGAERERERERDLGEGEGPRKGNLRPADAARPDPTWVRDAHEIYREEIGIVPHGRIGKALKPAVIEHGWESVERWFRAYCQWRPYQRRDGSLPGERPGDKLETWPRNTDQCSPEHFVKNLSVWRAQCEPVASS